jgi:hypothetical protein
LSCQAKGERPISQDDFPSRELVKLLLMNKELSKLSPLANKVNDYLTSAGSLLRRGAPPIFTPALSKRAATAKSLGHNTTSLTYAMHKVGATEDGADV